jgi:hypothetical protein
MISRTSHIDLALPDSRMPVAVTTMRNRSLSRPAELFIRAARELIKPLTAQAR